MKHAFPKSFVAIDLETTGLDPEKAAIIEVAAVRFRDGREVETFNTLVDPQKKIPFIVTDITGITDADVAGKPTIDSVMPELQEFIGTHPVVGHNVAFDLAFLRRSGFGFDGSVFDTWKLATLAFRNLKSYSLENIALNLNLDTGTSHRALDDTKLAANLFYLATDTLATDFSKEVLLEVASFVRGKSWDCEEVVLTLLDSDQALEVTKINTGKQAGFGKGFDSVSDLYESSELKEAYPDFEYKDAQKRVVAGVVQTLGAEEKHVYEVMPDSGRILASLLGAAVASYSKKQPTLYATTLPVMVGEEFVQDVLNTQRLFSDLSIHIIKSPEDYLDLDAFELFARRQDLGVHEVDLAVKVLFWKSKTTTGDFEELALIREQRALLHEISAKDYDGDEGVSYAAKAFVQFKSADVAITSHQALLKHLVRGSEMKRYSNLVIDLADQLETTATNILTQTISQEIVANFFDQISRPAPGVGFLQRVKAESTKQDSKVEKLEQQVQEVADSTTLFFGILGVALRTLGSQEKDGPFYEQLLLDNNLWNELEGKKVVDAASKLVKKFALLEKNLDAHKKYVPDQLQGECERILRRLSSLRTGLNEMLLEQDGKWINWALLMQDREFFMKRAPLHVASFLRDTLWEKHSVALLSRGITEENKLSYFKRQLGLEEFTLVHHFDYDFSKTVQFLQVTDMPAPENPKFTTHAIDIIVKTLEQTKKNALVVVPSFTASQSYYEKLKPLLKDLGYDVFAQGVSGGKNKVAEQIKERKHSVLVASPYFLQNVELPADRTPVIFMMKFPFVPLGDPLFKAREQQFGNSFMEYSLPLAIQMFRRSFLRLPEANREHKLLVLFDRRFAEARYAENVLSSLPPHNHRRTSLAQVVQEGVDWLNRPVEK